MAVDMGGVTQIIDLKPAGYPARFSGAPHGRRLRDLKVGLRRGRKVLFVGKTAGTGSGFDSVRPAHGAIGFWPEGFRTTSKRPYSLSVQS